MKDNAQTQTDKDFSEALGIVLREAETGQLDSNVVAALVGQVVIAIAINRLAESQKKPESRY